jgi:N-methylhydantoinase A
MVRAVKSVSTYRGRDPRTHTLIAFGGNGPLVAAAIARELSMRWVLVPPHPGVLSACGLLAADHEQEQVRSFPRLMAGLDAAALDAAFGVLVEQARSALVHEGFATDVIEIERRADVRYVGQAYELTVPATGDPAAIAAAFHQEHLRTNGHSAEAEPVEMVSLRVIARVPTPEPASPPQLVAQDRRDLAPMRDAYFGDEYGLLATPILRREDLVGRSLAGPVIIEEYDSTCVVPPWARVSLDSRRNLVIELEPVA